VNDRHRELRLSVLPHLLVLLVAAVAPCVLVLSTTSGPILLLKLRGGLALLAAAATGLTLWLRERVHGSGQLATPWLVGLAGLSIFGSGVVYLLPLGPEPGPVALPVQWWDYLPAALAMMPGAVIILLLHRARLAALTIATAWGGVAAAVDSLWAITWGLNFWGGPPAPWQTVQRDLTVMLCLVHLALAAAAFMAHRSWKRAAQDAGHRWPPPGEPGWRALAGLSGFGWRFVLFGLTLAITSRHAQLEARPEPDHNEARRVLWRVAVCARQVPRASLTDGSLRPLVRTGCLDGDLADSERSGYRFTLLPGAHGVTVMAQPDVPKRRAWTVYMVDEAGQFWDAVGPKEQPPQAGRVLDNPAGELLALQRCVADYVKSRRQTTAPGDISTLSATGCSIFNRDLQFVDNRAVLRGAEYEGDGYTLTYTPLDGGDAVAFRVEARPARYGIDALRSYAVDARSEIWATSEDRPAREGDERVERCRYNEGTYRPGCAP
jgi:hypothetical protein